MKQEPETISDAEFVELESRDIEDSLAALAETDGTSLEDFIGELK